MIIKTLFETEQLKAYSRVLEIHVHYLFCKEGQIFHSYKLMRKINHKNELFWFAWFCLYTTIRCARNVASSFL